MTRQQIKNKKADLRFWLENNKYHPDYSSKLRELKELDVKLAAMTRYE